MDLLLAVENASTSTDIPDDSEVHRWVTTALQDLYPAAEISIRIVGEAESALLNHQYRNKSGATNVLSFSADLPAELSAHLPCPPLGDLVICAPVVEREAKIQDKPRQAHWAHMVVHGCLHLAGYDHIADDEAAEMEALEQTILATCGFPNPYNETETELPGAEN